MSANEFEIEGDIVVTEKDYFAETKVPTWNNLSYFGEVFLFAYFLINISIHHLRALIFYHNKNRKRKQEEYL